MKIIWNAHVKVERDQVGRKGDQVGLGWGVTDDVSGNPLDYHADITLTLPQRADASVTKCAPNETVVLNRDASLTCGPNTIEAIVTYRVSPQKTGANGNVVAVSVANNTGQMTAPTGGVLGQATGQVGQDITVRIVIPASCG
jgi:hypothetical protein